MNVSRRANSRKWKLAVKIALGCVLAADAALGVVSWRAASEAPQAQAQQVARLTQEARLLAADVQRGQAIEKRLPDLQKECDQFYQKDLLPSSSGYAAVIADIGQMAKDAGVQTSGVKFNPKEVKDRALEQVQISSSVQGDYQGLIRLIDEIERSPHFYLLDELALASQKSGTIELQLKLRTYFRT